MNNQGSLVITVPDDIGKVDAENIRKTLAESFEICAKVGLQREQTDDDDNRRRNAVLDVGGGSAGTVSNSGTAVRLTALVTVINLVKSEGSTGNPVLADSGALASALLDTMNRLRKAARAHYRGYSEDGVISASGGSAGKIANTGIAAGIEMEINIINIPI